MSNIAMVSALIVLLVTSGCAHKDLNHTESQEYVDNLCRSVANRIPSPENMTMLPNISYSDCMVNHGYIEKLSSQ